MSPLLLLALGGGAWVLLSKPKASARTYDILFQTPAKLSASQDPKPQLCAALFGACGAKSITSSLTAPSPGKYVYTVTLDKECPLPSAGTVVALHFGRGVSIPATILAAQLAPVQVPAA
jgi:hypothetical protein